MKKKLLHPRAAVTLKMLLRRKGSSIVLTTAMLAATLASIILCGLQARQEAAIAEMVENTQIRCTVTNARGSGVDNLEVGSFFVDMLVGLRHGRGCYLDEYVKDVRALAWEELAQPAGSEVRRIYSTDSDSDLSAINGGAVHFYDNWSEECFLGNEQVCLVTEDLLEETQADSSGDIYVTLVRKGGTEVMLKVIGTVAGQMSQRIYCPFYTDLQNGDSEAFPLASCSFTIRNNQLLEESKQNLYEYFAHPAPLASNNYTTAGLLVHDEIYLSSMEEFENNLSLLRLILPVLVIITGGAGFLSAYLTNRGRQKEFAVMRCIGIKRLSVFLQVFLEQSFLAVCGCGVGMILGLLFGENIFLSTLGLVAVLLAVCLLGAAGAAWQISSVNVMKLMKVEE